MLLSPENRLHRRIAPRLRGAFESRVIADHLVRKVIVEPDSFDDGISGDEDLSDRRPGDRKLGAGRDSFDSSFMPDGQARSEPRGQVFTASSTTELGVMPLPSSRSEVASGDLTPA